MSTRQRLTLIVLLGAGFLFSADFSILTIALPDVGAALGLDTPTLPWVITAFALPAAGFTLLFGRVADLVGRRRLFLAGVVLLICASLVGGAAANAGMLLAARTLQGFATALATPAALALLITAFPDARQRARVLGLNGALLSGGFAFGALSGGVLVAALGWRWAFLINVPVAVAVLVVTPLVIPASRAPSGVRLDVPGAVVVTTGLLAFTFGVTERRPLVLVVGLALLAAFVLVERRVAAPLVSLGLLRRPTVRWGNLAGLVVFSVEPAMIYLTTLYLQDVLHFSALSAGLLFGIPGLGSVVAGVLAGRIASRHGARSLLVAGLAVQALSTVPLIALGDDRVWLWALMPALFVGFFGHVTALVCFLITATAGFRDAEQGLATGLASLTQQVGATIGVPLLSAVAALRSGLLPGIRLAMLVDVVVTLVAVGAISAGLRSRGEPTAAGSPHDAAVETTPAPVPVG